MVDERPRCHVCAIIDRDGGPCLAWVFAHAIVTPFGVPPPTCVRTNIDPKMKG